MPLLSAEWCGKCSLSLCQIHFQDYFLSQLTVASPPTGPSTHPTGLNIISRQFVLHNLTPSVKNEGVKKLFSYIVGVTFHVVAG